MYSALAGACKKIIGEMAEKYNRELQQLCFADKGT